MKRAIKSYIKQNPLQVYLMIYNLGLYSWLQSQVNKLSSGPIMELLNEGNNLFFRLMGYIGLENVRVQEILSIVPIRWLIVSVVLSIILNFVGKVFRLIISIGIILGGLYLVYVYGKELGYFL
ncbi:hypothetical protein [Streptococcus suis]|uniref:hypothetical protein n=1 Tax=Streptococcus suis TaxID=1307 RepID=UPI0038BDB76C